MLTTLYRSGSPGESPTLTVELWDSASGKSIGRIVQASLDLVAFSSDGKLLLTVTDTGTARTWEVAAAREIGRPVEKVIAASPDCMTLLTSISPDKRAEPEVAGQYITRLYDQRTGKHFGKLMIHKRNVEIAVFSSDGRAILTGGGTPKVPRTFPQRAPDFELRSEGESQLWYAKTGEAIGPRLQHAAPLVAAAISKDHEVFATAAWDGTVRLWNSGLGRPIGPALHDRYVSNITFVSEDTRVVGEEHQGAGAWLLNVPVPIQGDVNQVVLWVQAMTGMEIDENDVVRQVDNQTWRDRCRQLEQAGGSPFSLTDTTKHRLGMKNSILAVGTGETDK